MTDQQCIECEGIWNCKDAFKKKGNCENVTRGWGTCRKCTRIISPQHSNCPKCGSREIKPVCEDLRLEKMKEENK